MPVKIDETGRRWVEMEFLVPGAPEQVWHAVATGPGMSAWCMPVTIDEYVGGTITFDFGDGDRTSGPVTVWEPPARFAFEEAGWSGDAPPVTTEVTVATRPPDRCLVRMVHSLFTDKTDWDAELESFEGGWPALFGILRIYLADFADQPSATVSASATCGTGQAAVWAKLMAALDLAGADVGERRSTPPGAPRLVGTVERIQQDRRARMILLRVAEPTAGVASIGTCRVSGKAMANVSVYLYGVNAIRVADAEQPHWTAWLSELLASD
jgi:uncharacterized protein YndB with AHSA1/START domain